MLGTKIKPYLQRPSGVGVTPDMASFYDWVQTSLNALIGQQPPPGAGFTALTSPKVNPASSQLTSVGSRVQSLATKMSYVATPNSISFYWDGTNGSAPLTIYRDDYSIITPNPGHLVVASLAPNTTYYFYPFYDESDGEVKFLDDARADVLSRYVAGVPGVAYNTQNTLAAQSQFYQQHISLASSLGSAGITTPGTGSTNATATGGGGGGAAFYPVSWPINFPY